MPPTGVPGATPIVHTSDRETKALAELVIAPLSASAARPIDGVKASPRTCPSAEFPLHAVDAARANVSCRVVVGTERLTLGPQPAADTETEPPSCAVATAWLAKTAPQSVRGPAIRSFMRFPLVAGWLLSATSVGARVIGLLAAAA